MFTARKTLPLFLVTLLCSLSFGATLTVKKGETENYTIIQAAVDVAGPHDILVDPCYIQTGHESWPADLDGVRGVDFRDFAVLALNWQKSNIIPPVSSSPLILETFESYTATGNSTTVGTLLGPRVSGKPVAWRVPNWTYYSGPLAGALLGTSTLSLLTTDANSGTKSMEWDYDVNVPPNNVNGIRYTEILVVLADEVNFVTYNEMRVSLKRLAGNSPDYETFMYAKFLDNIYGIWPWPPYMTGINNSDADINDIANSVIGGPTATPVGVYYDWVINFDNYAGWTNGYGVYPNYSLRHVGAIIFGVQTQATGPYGNGKGTIYVDDIRLIDRPGCTPFVEDLNGDCKVTFADVREFALYWLMGK